MAYEQQNAEPQQAERPDLGLSPEQIEALLKEIRDFREYAEDRWKKIREESQKDRRYLNGDPWDAADRKAREDAGRPCINHDELNQYVNQAVNNVRANKRGIKVAPAGGGSSEQSAELRQGLIRGIEYKSKGQQAYITAFQHLVESRYGFFRISRQYVNDEEDDQEIVIKPILNQDSVLYDPDCKEADWSDARRCLVLDVRQKDDFEARWPWAKVQDYGDKDGRIAKHWIQSKTVTVAEFWKVHVTRARSITGKRWIEQKRVCKYLTNGLDILEVEELVTADGKPMGQHIPIIPMFGPQRYVDEGSGPEVTMASLVGLGREPQLSLAFLVSQQLEEAGLAPRIPFIGYEGQFETETPWDTVHKVPVGYAEVKATTPESEAKGAGLLPLPQFTQFTPNTAAFEVAKDSCRRAIQAAMGISPLPTAAQRTNEKSGKALERIQAQQQIGSFHFNDIFDNALEYAGRVIDSWLPAVYDTPREVALGMQDDSTKVAMVGPELLAQGDHGLTISAAPSNESQREAASEFLDHLVSNLQSIPQPGTPPAKLLAKAIRMKQLGTIGDEMADILDPQDQPEIPPQAVAAIQKAEQQVQVMGELLKQYQQELAEAKQKIEAKVIDNAAKREIEQIKAEVSIAVAEINSKAQLLKEREAFVMDLAKQLGVQVHESTEAEAARQHEAQMASEDRQHTEGMEAAKMAHTSMEADANRQHESAESAESRAAEERKAKLKPKSSQ